MVLNTFRNSPWSFRNSSAKLTEIPFKEAKGPLNIYIYNNYDYIYIIIWITTPIMCLSKHWVHPKSIGELSCFPVFDCHWCGACPIPDKRIWKQLLMYRLVFFSKILDNPWFWSWSVWIWWYEMTWCKAELGSTSYVAQNGDESQT